MATTPEKIDFSKLSIFNWIETFIADYASNIGSAESDLQNISRDYETIKSKISNNPQMIECVDKLHTLAEKEIEVEGSFNRGQRYFENGVLMLICNTLKTLLKTYGSILTQSNYTETEILDLLDEIHALELNISNQTITLQADVDTVISFLRKEGAELAEKTGLFNEFSIFDLEDTAKDINELQSNFNDFLTYFKDRIIQAAIFTFHMRIKENNKDDTELKEIKERLIKLLGEDKLNAALKVHDENFDLVAQARNRRDAIHPNVRRIKYIYQAYDKACFFNTGYCHGGVRMWIESIESSNLTRMADQKKSNFLTYKDAHDFEVTSRIAHLQINQHSTNQLNESGNHIIFYTALKSFDQPFFKMTEEEQAKLKSETNVSVTVDREAVQKFTDLMLDDIQRVFESYHASNQQSPAVNIIFCSKNVSSADHVFGIKPFNVGDNVLFRVMDLNDGEFEIDSLQDLRKWLPEFFIGINYHDLYDSYKLQILQPKPKNPFLSATSLEYMLKNRSQARETFQSAYMNHKDNIQRREIAKLFTKSNKDETNSVKYLKKELECFRKIHNKTVFDHQVALLTFFSLTMELDDPHPEEALIYLEKTISITKYLFSIKGPKGKAKIKSRYLAFEGLLHIYKGLLQEKIKPGSSLEAMKKGCKLIKSVKFNITAENEKDFKQLFETVDGLYNLVEQGKHKDAYVLSNKLTEAMGSDIISKQMLLPLFFTVSRKLREMNVLELPMGSETVLDSETTLKSQITLDSETTLKSQTTLDAETTLDDAETDVKPETPREDGHELPPPESNKYLLELAAAYEEAHANLKR